MKNLLAVALCALLAIHAAEARTIYVDATRPNNKGSGLKISTAKKTIQAAINIAKKGDTILVYPGTYGQISSSNKKISIKSVKGTSLTTIKRTKQAKKKGSWEDSFKGRSTWSSTSAVAKLGAEKRKKTTLLGKSFAYPVAAKGSATKLTGFTLDGKGDAGYGNWRVFLCEVIASKSGARKMKEILSYADVGVAGGTVISCVLTNFGHVPLAINSKVVASKIVSNYSENPDLLYSRNSMSQGFCAAALRGIENSSFTRCVFDDNHFKVKPHASVMYSSSTFNAGYPGGINNSRFYNCLFAGNTSLPFNSCTLINCTTANNFDISLSKTKASNCVFTDVAAAQFKKSKKNTVKNCYRGSAPRFVDGNPTRQWVEATRYEYSTKETGRCIWIEKKGYVYEAGFGLRYKTNGYYIFGYFEPVSGGGDYRLNADSPRIDKGKLTKAQKELVETKDLAGGKRIKGKAVDIGCYEY